jgi:peptidoglycan/xylan/chitin deacetylase (PgdA/CDA1 family)
MRGRLAAAVALPLLANAAPGLASLSPALGRPFGIRHRLAGAGGVALSFDDGPHPRGTPEVLERLAEARARATFFLVGEQVLRWPAVAAEIAARGHEIGLHCHSHRLLLRLSPSQVEEDLRRGAASIEDATGISPSLHRPPYGAFSVTGLLLARRAGWLPVRWSRDTKDWRGDATPASIVARATGRLRAGDIVLLHDADHYGASGCWKRTVAALPGLLRALDERGLATEHISHGSRSAA